MSIELQFERSQYPAKKIIKLKKLSKRQKKKLKKILKLAYVAGWVDRQFDILRPDKHVDKILKYLYK